MQELPTFNLNSDLLKHLNAHLCQMKTRFSNHFIKAAWTMTLKCIFRHVHITHTKSAICEEISQLFFQSLRYINRTHSKISLPTLHFAQLWNKFFTVVITKQNITTIKEWIMVKNTHRSKSTPFKELKYNVKNS